MHVSSGSVSSSSPDLKSSKVCHCQSPGHIGRVDAADAGVTPPKRPSHRPVRGGSGTPAPLSTNGTPAPLSLSTSACARRLSVTLILRLRRCCCRRGGMASCALTALPTSADLVVPDAEYRVMVLRLPLLFAPRRCRCGRALDTLGDHRTACAQVGVLAHRAGPLERAAGRICREARARVVASVALRDLNIDVPATDGRRIVANGLPLWRGAQIAVATTLVTSLQPRPGADVEPSCARKLRTYPRSRPGAHPAVALPCVIGGTARTRANAA